MIYLLALSLLSYGWIIIRRWFAWQELPVQHVHSGYEATLMVSVIIPVRNEASNIGSLLSDLDKQRYPKGFFEVLIIDDHSDDATVSIVEAFQATSDLQLRIVKLSDYEGLTQKKAAVKKGIELAHGDLIVLTDGDCHVQPDWLLNFSFTHTSTKALFISGPVSFHRTNSLFEKMQLVEFSSLIGIGGASIGIGKPNMCNGANLAYTKAIFQEVGGFEGNENIASGDDEFLLHKINKKFPGKVAFLKNRNSIVFTEARKTLNAFMAQRIRWASKWKAYQELHVQLVAMSVFMVNLLLFIAIPLLFTGQLSLLAFAASYTVKFAIDFLFLRRILSFMGRPGYIAYMLPLQLVYIPYVVITGISGLFGRYTWKGRTIQNK